MTEKKSDEKQISTERFWFKVGAITTISFLGIWLIIGVVMVVGIELAMPYNLVYSFPSDMRVTFMLTRLVIILFAVLVYLAIFLVTLSPFYKIVRQSVFKDTLKAHMRRQRQQKIIEEELAELKSWAEGNGFSFCDLDPAKPKQENVPHD